MRAKIKVSFWIDSIERVRGSISVYVPTAKETGEGGIHPAFLNQHLHICEARTTYWKDKDHLWFVGDKYYEATSWDQLIEQINTDVHEIRRIVQECWKKYKELLRSKPEDYTEIIELE